MKPVVVVGDVLLDRDLDGPVERLCPDAPVPVVDRPVTRSRPGGAGLAAVLGAAYGRPVVLVTALADDEPAAELRALLAAAGVTVIALPSDGSTAQKVRIHAAGHAVLRLDHGASGRVGELSPAARVAIREAGAVLVSDYGRGVTAEPSVRRALATAARRHPVVWDPHPRGADPVPGARLVTPNQAEAARLVPDAGGQELTLQAARAAALVQRWRASGVSITLGDKGALFVGGDGTPLAVPAPTACRGAKTDSCGAGDSYAIAAAGALADGALPSEAVVDAVGAASAFVGAGGVSALPLQRSDGAGGGTAGGAADPVEVVAATRARGGTVVAAGGCFDLLHAGHVRMLQEARALGDCLIVCLNSDESVRRLKGPGRPVVGEADRAAVLSGLGCVDAVTVFDEDTPEAILDRLRPDVWAKGADYNVIDLPEADLVASWGGQVIVLPYLPGRSTSTLIEEVAQHAQ